MVDSRIIDDLSFWIIYVCTCDFTASLYETLIRRVQLPPKTRQVLLQHPFCLHTPMNQAMF